MNAPTKAVATSPLALTPNWRADFPGLDREVHGRPLVYLDSANTSQKPRVVIDAVSDYYQHYCANVYRGVHTLSEQATARFERTRDLVAGLLNTGDRRQIVLTRGTTEALNLVAHGLGQVLLQPGDEILVSRMEHHANLVPWQMQAQKTGARLVELPITIDGELDLKAARERLASPRAKVLALVHVSNVLGTINPVAELCALARKQGVVSVIDGSQAVPHLAVDVQALGCDFYAFTGHKLCAPTGTGALYGRGEWLARLPPLFGGGEMIREVEFETSSYADPPQRFEAGTPNIAGIIGLGTAIEYLQAIGYPAIEAHERALTEQLLATLHAVPGLKLYGRARNRVPVASFLIDGAHAHDLALILDHHGIAVRSGQHCAHPLLKWFGVSATLRASLALYNNADDIDALSRALPAALKMLL